MSLFDKYDLQQHRMIIKNGWLRLIEDVYISAQDNQPIMIN
jgi:hypothetical protein